MSHARESLRAPSFLALILGAALCSSVAFAGQGLTAVTGRRWKGRLRRQGQYSTRAFRGRWSSHDAHAAVYEHFGAYHEWAFIRRQEDHGIGNLSWGCKAA